MDFEHIQALIQQFNESDIAELRIEQDDFKITLRSPSYVEAIQKGKAPATPIVMPSFPTSVQNHAPVPPLAVAPLLEATNSQTEAAPETSSAPPSSPADADFVTVRSPMIGTFYRSLNLFCVLSKP